MNPSVRVASILSLAGTSFSSRFLDLSGHLLFLYRRDVSRRFELAPQIYETMRELAGEQAA